MKVRVRHELGAEAAIQRALSRLDALRPSLPAPLGKLEVSRGEAEIIVSCSVLGRRLGGRLIFGAEDATADYDLPMLFRPFAAKVEARVRRELVRALRGA